MPSYLVEIYLPRSRPQHAHATAGRARAAAEELSDEGLPVRYVRALFLPADETCFLLFEAASVVAVEAVSRRARLGGARIVLAVEAP